MRVQCINCKQPVIYNIEHRRWVHKANLERACQMKFLTPIQYVV